MGTPQTSSFTVKAATADGEVSGVPGSFTIKPRLPTWAIPLLTTLALIICAAGAFAYSNIQKGKVAKATEQALSAANQTATAVALAQIGADKTAQAMGADEALTATAAVATATAEWLNADPDGDGLTNEQEMQWGTDPNNKDTDGDTLSDGEEVDRGISPISKDTDGDGIQDNVDAAPGELPTWTPVPTEVPTPTPYFQPNKLQTFSFTTGYIGSVNKVCLKQDNSGENPGWYVSYVEVDTGSGYKKYTFDRWLAEDKGDGALTDCREQKTPTPVPTRTKTPTKIPTKVPTGIWLIKTPMFKLPTAMMIKPGLILVPFKTPSEQVFKLRIKTGNVADAGTSAQVSIRIYGTTGDTGWKTLN